MNLELPRSDIGGQFFNESLGLIENPDRSKIVAWQGARWGFLGDLSGCRFCLGLTRATFGTKGAPTKVYRGDLENICFAGAWYLAVLAR